MDGLGRLVSQLLPQSLPCNSPVLVLTALLGCRHDNAGGQMSQANTGIGLVAMLSAGSRCAKSVNTDVRLVNGDGRRTDI